MIIVLFINSAGLLYFYLAQRNEIRTNMFAWLKTGEADKFCTVFDFPVNTSGNIESHHFNWELYNKEFIYKGKLYDVVTVVVNNGRVSIRCVADNAEDHLLRKMHVLMNPRKENKSPSSDSLLKFFSIFVSAKSTGQFQVYTFPIIHRAASYYCCYAQGFHRIQTPPPKMG